MSRARFSAEFILRAYKSSAFLFCFFGFILIEFGFYLNPIFKFGVIKIIGMIFVFFVAVFEWRDFFVGKFGSVVYRGSLIAYKSTILYFICGILAFSSIFFFHNKLLVMVGMVAMINTVLSGKISKIIKNDGGDADFFNIYFKLLHDRNSR